MAEFLPDRRRGEQNEPEFLQAPRQIALGRPDGRSHDGCGLGLGQPLDDPQHHCGSLAGRQPRKRCVQLSAGSLRLGQIQTLRRPRLDKHRWLVDQMTSAAAVPHQVDQGRADVGVRVGNQPAGVSQQVTSALPDEQREGPLLIRIHSNKNEATAAEVAFALPLMLAGRRRRCMLPMWSA